MSAGMADVIAAHRGYTVKLPPDYTGPFLLLCNGCGDERPIINEVGNVRTPWDRHATHVAEELTKAGYGNVQETLLTAADEMERERATWCLDDSGRYWITRTLNELRERAHSLDPEGHALVQAIHDRKAQG